jgi:hypothetical protein
MGDNQDMLHAFAAAVSLLCAYLGSWACTKKPPPEWTLGNQIESALALQAWSFAYMIASSTFAAKCYLWLIIDVVVTASFMVWGLRMRRLNRHIRDLMARVEEEANELLRLRPHRPPRRRVFVPRRQPDN